MTDQTVSAATIVEGVSPHGGVHCETTALGVLLAHAGVALSEPLRFGLASALSFIYWDSTQQPRPFLGGRVKPFALTENLAARLGVELRVQETSSAAKAWDQVRASINAGMPVGLQLDSFHLEYFGSPVHFAGHVVAMYGYDAERAHLVDTRQQGGAVTTSLGSLALARAARGPMSARHRSFTLHVPDPDAVIERVPGAILPAIRACAEEFVSPPIANLGHRGIRTTATRIGSWFQRVDDPAEDLPLIASLMERAGTGGALFRNLYRDFLTESVEIIDGSSAVATLRTARDRFAEAALLWTAVSELIAQAGVSGDPTPLTGAARHLRDIAEIETQAMTALCALPDERP